MWDTNYHTLDIFQRASRATIKAYMWKVFMALVLYAIPQVILAAGLVPCGGPGEPECQSCHVVQLISQVLAWLVVVLGVLAAIMIVVSGLRMVLSVGNTAAKESAKKTISNMLIGYALVLAGWMLVDTVMKMLLDDASATYGVWNVVQCTTQPYAIQWSRTTASGDNVATLPPAAVATRVTAIASSGSLQTDIINAAKAAGITDPAKIKILQGLISQESSNCVNKVGPATGSGTAYGCGQILVSTARTLDPALKGLSDAEVAKKLTDDNTYNITLSAKYYDQLLDRFGGNTDLALAAYNGGPGANQPSTDCPGQRRWQCVWDSPGCYGTTRTDCARNEGPDSYAQTRYYVTNINAIADRI
jgi:hypothetical protein